MSEWAGVPAALGPLFAAAWQSWFRASLAEIAGKTGDFGVPTPELLDALGRERVALLAWLGAAHGLETEIAGAVVRYIRHNNQFFDLDAAAHSAFVADLAAGLERARSLCASEPRAAELEALFDDFRQRVASLIRAQLGAAPRDIVQSEYSSDLVLAVLGLTLETLRDPILDVGCGSRAALVRALRAEGHVAHGLDREAPLDVGSAADWLSFDFGKERWGTVLSHLGFSLYFWHHHLKGGEAPLRYAHAHMNILRSLAIGGTFAYAPALPFMEQLLPAATYRVESGPLPDELRIEAVVGAERTTGVALGTRTRIERIAR